MLRETEGLMRGSKIGSQHKNGQDARKKSYLIFFPAPHTASPLRALHVVTSVPLPHIPARAQSRKATAASRPHVSPHLPYAVRHGHGHRLRSSSRPCRRPATGPPRSPARGAGAPDRRLVPHAAAPRGARRQEAPWRRRDPRRGRGLRPGVGGRGVGGGASGVRGVDGADAVPAGPEAGRLLGGTPVGSPRLLRAVHVGFRRRLLPGCLWCRRGYIQRWGNRLQRHSFFQGIHNTGVPRRGRIIRP